MKPKPKLWLPLATDLETMTRMWHQSWSAQSSGSAAVQSGSCIVTHHTSPPTTTTTTTTSTTTSTTTTTTTPATVNSSTLSANDWPSALSIHCDLTGNRCVAHTCASQVEPCHPNFEPDLKNDIRVSNLRELLGWSACSVDTINNCNSWLMGGDGRAEPYLHTYTRV